MELSELYGLDETTFRRRFRHTPLWRSHRRGLLRNAAIVLGNQKDDSALTPLAQGLRDVEPLVRGACAWALGQLGSQEAREILLGAESSETDPQVHAEIELALQDDRGS